MCSDSCNSTSTTRPSAPLSAPQRGPGRYRRSPHASAAPPGGALGFSARCRPPRLLGRGTWPCRGGCAAASGPSPGCPSSSSPSSCSGPTTPTSASSAWVSRAGGGRGGEGAALSGPRPSAGGRGGRAGLSAAGPLSVGLSVCLCVCQCVSVCLSVSGGTPRSLSPVPRGLPAALRPLGEAGGMRGALRSRGGSTGTAGTGGAAA